MRQDNIIAAFVFLAFIVYITLKGELRTYMGFFVPGNGASTGAGYAGSNPSNPSTGTPGFSLNPFAGLPNSWSQFLFGGSPLTGGK